MVLSAQVINFGVLVTTYKFGDIILIFRGRTRGSKLTLVFAIQIYAVSSMGKTSVNFDPLVRPLNIKIISPNVYVVNNTSKRNTLADKTIKITILDFH